MEILDKSKAEAEWEQREGALNATHNLEQDITTVKQAIHYDQIAIGELGQRIKALEIDMRRLKIVMEAKE